SSPGIYTRNMQTGEFLEFNDRHKAAARYGAPYYTFHRADLLDAFASGLDHRAIHLGHRLTGLEERSDRIILAFANGAQVEAESVIGADGVRCSTATMCRRRCSSRRAMSSGSVRVAISSPITSAARSS